MTVANRITIGKLENSIGVDVFIATIMIRSERTILKVNIMSSMNAGIGKINRVRTSNTKAGVVTAPDILANGICRKFDIK